MSGLEIFFGILIILFAVSIVLVVLFQEGRQQSVGAMTGGGGDTFLAKNKSRSIDAFLARWTRFIAVVFFFLVIIVNVLTYFKVFG